MGILRVVGLLIYFKDGFKYNFVRSNGWQSKKLFEDERKQLMKYLEETLEGR